MERYSLVRLLVTLHRKRLHRLGGEAEVVAPAGEPLVSPLGLVAVADVLGHRVTEAVPAEVVAVLYHQLADRAEVALDPIQVARVGRSGDELDVALVGPDADRGRPVAGEVVLDPVDPRRGRIGEPNLAHEGEGGGAVATGPGPRSQVVGMDVERAHQVADALAAGVGRPLPLGPACSRPAAPGL